VVRAPRGTASQTHSVTANARTENAAQAQRQLPVKSSATGPDTSTPSPVPALTTVCSRGSRLGAADRATACAIGGEASPVLDPARTTPQASANVPGAAAMTAVPAVAHAPAAIVTGRAPHREVASVATTMATQYPA
jgi:hypothetical protein